MTRKHYDWHCGNRTIELGNRTRVMGILNVTPDSFSDGGSYSDTAAAVERALEMVDQGADMIDIGGESTRPGATPVSISDEIRRTVPVITQLRTHSNIPISIDTMKSTVAREAMQAGADIINDVSALTADPKMAEVVASTQSGVVLMHMKGTPQTMQKKPTYAHVASEVLTHLNERIEQSIQDGIAREQIVVDPGIGFGKTVEHNLNLLRALPDFETCNRPILIGASRKSFIGHLLNQETAEERVAGSLGVAAWSMLNGTHILRVHDVLDTCDVRSMLDTLLCGER